MKSSAFEYSRPGTVAEAVGLLAGSDGNAMPICRGPSLLILMGLRFAITGLLVDISRLEDLRRVDQRDGHVFIGAATTHAAIEDGKVPDLSLGLMSRVASRAGDRGEVNLRTLAGGDA